MLCSQALAAPAPSGALTNPLTKQLQEDAQEAYRQFKHHLHFVLRVLSTPSSKASQGVLTICEADVAWWQVGSNAILYIVCRRVRRDARGISFLKGWHRYYSKGEPHTAIQMQRMPDWRKSHHTTFRHLKLNNACICICMSITRTVHRVCERNCLCLFMCLCLCMCLCLFAGCAG